GSFFWAGIISSFVFTLLAIKFILGYVKKHSYRIFAYYRFALAALILIFILERQ
ncbi:UDP-diphosphatase, partial [Patescibacteria group bacterium]|nr:UDP-diphosphatase [Patescibacteria group bacterium]